VQFSNDVRVELPLEPLDRAAFHTLMASMVCASRLSSKQFSESSADHAYGDSTRISTKRARDSTK